MMNVSSRSVSVGAALLLLLFFSETTFAVSYGELTCNANVSPKINTDECLNGAIPLSFLLESGTTTVSSSLDIPCGTCYKVDYTNGETITIEGGLNVLGRLHFPSTANMVLNTTSVVVQGMWSMTTPDVGNTVKISLYGADDVYIYPHDNCCIDGACDSECDQRDNLASKPFAVVGGQLDIRVIDENCPSWTILKRVDASSKTLTVENSMFASCLAVGDELVVAADEFYDDRQYGRYTIASVSGEDVVVVEDITKSFATLEGPGEPMFATEVTTLTRRVLFEGREDVANIGAHTIIFHTPDVLQTIQGVSFKGFGQGGKLGRYPIHFHKCNDTPSLVSKNVIRDSHQRCIFIHDTNQVTVDDNVAFSTRGHCYATETGNEHDNVFTNNLAMETKKLLVSGTGQSDDPAKQLQNAAFWIRNMMNTFVNNRVAGCDDTGIWLEMKVKYGNQLNDDSFRDNVAHSCRTGLLTYKQGWIPAEGGHFKNIKVYKNWRGFKFHFTGIKFTNFVAADDRTYTYGFRNAGVDFEDSLFIGLSDDYRLRLNKDCPETNHGIDATFNNLLDGSNKQVHFKNVEFRNFNCNSRTITWGFDDRFANRNMGDPLVESGTTFTGTTLESARPALDCSTQNSQNWFMEDAHGVIGPNGKGPGFIIKDNAQMQAFLNGGCTGISYNQCSLMCEGACLRLVLIEPVGGGDYHSLTLTDQATQTSFTYTLDTWGESNGKAVVVVPKATYQGEFKDANGNSIITSSVNIEAFREPVCSNYVQSTDFTFQSDLCEGYYPGGVDKVVLSTVSESSLTYSSYSSGKRFPAIRLSASNENSCIRAETKLGVYFKAKLLNITDNNSPIDCIPGKNCPSGQFRIRQNKPDGEPYCNGWYYPPRSIVSWNKDEFNDVSSLFTVPAHCTGTDWKYFYFDINMGKGYPANTVEMIVDDVVVMIDEGQYTFPPTLAPIMLTDSPTSGQTTTPTTQCDGLFPNNAEKVILNEAFESQKGTTYGKAKTVLESPGASGEKAVAMTISKRNRRPSAIRIKISTGKVNACVQGGTQLNISFQAKMLDTANNNSPVDCTPGTDCPTARFRIRNKDPSSGKALCNGWYHIPKPTTAWNKDEYNTISTVWTVPSKCKVAPWRWIYIDITQGKYYEENNVKLMVDDLKISIKED